MEKLVNPNLLSFGFLNFIDSQEIIFLNSKKIIYKSQEFLFSFTKNRIKIFNKKYSIKINYLENGDKQIDIYLFIPRIIINNEFFQDLFGKSNINIYLNKLIKYEYLHFNLINTIIFHNDITNMIKELSCHKCYVITNVFSNSFIIKSDICILDINNLKYDGSIDSEIIVIPNKISETFNLNLQNFISNRCKKTKVLYFAQENPYINQYKFPILIMTPNNKITNSNEGNILYLKYKDFNFS